LPRSAVLNVREGFLAGTATCPQQRLWASDWLSLVLQCEPLDNRWSCTSVCKVQMRRRQALAYIEVSGRKPQDRQRRRLHLPLIRLNQVLHRPTVMDGDDERHHRNQDCRS